MHFKTYFLLKVNPLVLFIQLVFAFLFKLYLNIYFPHKRNFSKIIVALITIKTKKKVKED